MTLKTEYINDGLNVTLPDKKYESIFLENDSPYFLDVHVFSETNKEDPTRSRIRVLVTYAGTKRSKI